MTNKVLNLRIATGCNIGKRLTFPCIPHDLQMTTFLYQFLTNPIFYSSVFCNNNQIAQGQSFSDIIGLKQRHECFTHEQLYEAMSRATRASSIYLCIKRKDEKTTNLVYKTILCTILNMTREN